MPRNREEIKVGAMVILAAALFLVALVFVGGFNLFRQQKATYTTYFKFAGGLEPGAIVRFGGLKVGTVAGARIDPKDSTRIEVRMQVAAKTPIRVDSKARVSSLGFLGENYVEVSPGSLNAALLKPGSTIPAQEIVQIADVFDNVNNATVNANKLVGDLDTKVVTMADNANHLISNLNQVTGPENREHLNALLKNSDAMLADARPRVQKTLGNLESASVKLGPTMDQANKTIGHMDVLADNLNNVIEENRAEVHQALLRLSDALQIAERLMTNLDDTLDTNRPNIEEALENVRVSSENLKEFTETIKERPFSLIRVRAQKDRVPDFGK